MIERTALEQLSQIIQENTDYDVIEGRDLFNEVLTLISSRAKKLKTKLAWGRQGEPAQGRSTSASGKRKNHTILALRRARAALSSIVGCSRNITISHRGSSQLSIPKNRRLHFDLADREAEPTVTGRLPTRCAGDALARPGCCTRSYYSQAQIFPTTTRT